MKVYVAASSHEIPRAQGAMSALREAGHEITQDWTAIMRTASATDAELAKTTMGIGELQRGADACYRGVTAADLFWLLMPEGTSTGAWTELGIAVALRRQRGIGREQHFVTWPIIVVSGTHRRSCFWTLADRVFETDCEALDFINFKRWA